MTFLQRVTDTRSLKTRNEILSEQLSCEREFNKILLEKLGNRIETIAVLEARVEELERQIGGVV